MSAVAFTKAYIHRLCRDIGTSADAIYNEKTSSWYFASGSSTIEVFLTNMDGVEDTDRVFIRCFAPVCTIPENPVAQFELFRKALEINIRHMGIKLGILSSRGLLCLVAERDIEGMDYQEFVTIIQDIGFWADHFDDKLQAQAKEKPADR
jgi:Domain of unknown function (DUF1821).